MKTKYPSMFGVLAALLLVASFIIPVNLASPSAVEADPGICKWDTVLTPGSMALKGDLGGAFGLGTDGLDMAVGGDGATVLLITKTFIPPLPGLDVPAAGAIVNVTQYSNNMGITFSSVPFFGLVRAGQTQRGWATPWAGLEQCYQIAIAPDDPKFWAVTTDAPGGGTGPREVWVTTDAGSSFQWTGLVLPTAFETIRAIDISANYGGKRDIAVATADAVAAVTSASNIYVVKSTGFGGWIAQLPLQPLPRARWIDFEDIKFSPSYGADASLTVAFSDNVATYYNVAFRDLARNLTSNWQVGGLNAPLNAPFNNGIEVVDPAGLAFTSPNRTTLNNACIALPSDFNGQAASLRRAYISLDAYFGGAAKTPIDLDGIFRIDDTSVYTLMNTWNNLTKSIYSIAYFGTYASGKLLAGERMGFPCTATVPTWFTDSPTTCPIPCWYPALKPTTGAANDFYNAPPCSVNQVGFGGAVVGWRADGVLGFVSTGSLLAMPTPTAAGGWSRFWRLGILALGIPVSRDESAFAISRNNGETWNQLSLIDTNNGVIGAGNNLSRLVDMAPTPDCKTVYLATTNTVPGGTTCDEFDSVWRSSMNPEVVAPLPPLPIGIYWERVLCHVTAPTCADAQTDLALLRIVPYCADPSGQIVAWAVYDPTRLYTPGIAMWSPDYGDYWAAVTPRGPVQDFCFESATIMYFLTSDGSVQKMPYTGTSWANTLDSVTTVLPGTHTIAAYPEGKVLVGTNAFWANLYATSYCGNFNTDSPAFAPMALAGRTTFAGNVHVAFDTNFKDNETIFICDDDATTAGSGSVYRNTSAGFMRWDDGDMMAAVNGATGSLAPHQRGQFGLAIAFTGADKQCALYSAHAGIASTAAFAGENLVAVVTNASAAIGAATVLTMATNAGAATFTFAATDVTGSMRAAAPLAVTDVTGFTSALPAPTAASVTVEIRGATTNTLYGTVNLVTGVFIDGASTTGTAVGATPSGVCRTLWPLDGMPKPGIVWDCLTAGIPATNAVAFTREPSSLKLCGCCTLATDTSLYAIDNRAYAPAVGQIGVGMLWAFTDCMAKKGPALITADKMLVGCDPVSGRAQEVNLCWEQLCVANAYDIEIAKQPEFTIRIIDWVVKGTATGAPPAGFLTWDAAFLAPADVTSPCAFFPAGGLTAFISGSEIAAFGNLECGHTYYWRVQVRECATQQVVRSPWSEVRSFTVKAGLPVSTPYYGVQLLAPSNGCLGIPVKPVSFSWSPFKETTKYHFVLATDASMTKVVTEADVTGGNTAFEYDGTLEYSSNYFWRVMSIEPAPSDWSATFSFLTEAAPTAAPGPAKAPPTPVWVWVVIALGAILVIVTLVLIFKTRRV